MSDELQVSNGQQTGIEVQRKPLQKHDYLLLISERKDVRDVAAYYREGELPSSIMFLQSVEAPRKAAFAIPDGLLFSQQLMDLLIKAGLAQGHIELMPLRDFSDYYDQEILRQLRAIPGFTLSVYDPAEEDRRRKEEHQKQSRGLTFY